MTISKSIQLSLLALVSSCQVLLGGVLPFHSTVVLPEKFVVFIDSITWINQEGQRYEALTQPIAMDLRASDHIKLTDSLVYAGEVSFLPVQLEVRTRRYYDIKAEGLVKNEQNEIWVYTQKDQKAISISGVENLSLAASGSKGFSTEQRCSFPSSEGINVKLNSAGLGVHQTGYIIYTMAFNYNWLTENKDILLEVSCQGVEFGDSMIGAPYFVVPHLPYVNLVQVAKEP